MITTLKEWKLIKDSKKLVSTISSNLYELLKPLFNPSYLVERPSGHYSETIEIRFNKNTKYSGIIKIINDNNWYVVKYNNGNIRSLDFNANEISHIEIAPIYSNITIDNIPKYLYHLSPTINDNKILNNGILGSIGGKKGIFHPKRIYLSTDIDTVLSFIKELNLYVKEYTIWKIDTSKIKIDKLYVDQTVNQSFSNPKACYIQDINIIKNAISIEKQITI